MSINAAAPIPATATASGQVTSNKINPLLETGKGKGEDHFSFWDVLDVINPLQHIPIISNIYRSVTGDQISNVARVAGDALYGGIVGAAFGLANAVTVHEAGDDMGGVVMSKLGLLKSQEDAQAATDKKADGDTANVDTKDMPVVEVHPSDKNLKDQIIWDKPVQTAEAQPAAMPTPKQLNDIAPAAGAVSPPTNDPSVSKADVQKNMVAALDKYNAIQTPAEQTGLIKPKVAATPLGNLAASPPATDPAQQAMAAVKPQPTAAFKKLRHFSN